MEFGSGIIREPVTPFGYLSSLGKTAFIQNSATYNLLPTNFRSYTALSGTTGVSNKLFYVTTGTTSGGYGAIQSFRALNNKAGQGCTAILNAVFPTGVVSSWSGIGLINLSDELSFGRDGTTFGIWHRRGGAAEVRTITVTVASSGSTNLTLTLNTIEYTIPLTSGTTAHNAYEIAAWLNANQSVWSADQIGSTVIIAANSDGAKSGTYTYSHATSSGTITQNTAGVTKTSTHIPKANWNQNVMSGIDETLGNIYKIEYQDSGFGDASFYVMNPETGYFTLVHIIQYLNTSSSVNLSQPSLRFGMYVVSLGSTTDIAVRVASVGAFVNGDRNRTRNPRSFKNTQTITNAAFTNILTIRNRSTYNYFYNQVEILPINLNIASEAGKNVEIEIRTNPTFSSTGETNYTNVGNDLVSDYDISANTVSGGTLIAAFTVQSNGSRDVNLVPFEIVVPPSLQISISAKITSGASAPVTATLTYYEDI